MSAGLAWLVALVPTASHAQGQWAAAKESSLLVATRSESDPATPAEGEKRSVGKWGSLEPISQSSEHSPDLAEPSEVDVDAKELGAALQQAVPALNTVQPLRSTARRAAAVRSEALPYEPVKFQGMLVGKSTKSELVAAWGLPAESTPSADGTILVYQTKPFQSVEVLVSPAEVVSAIKITLETALDAAKLAEQLSLSQIESVTVNDDQGESIGQAFPETGVLFMFEESQAITPIGKSATHHKVSHVAIQPLDARAFALRAETHLHGPYQKNIEDLKTALVLDPDSAHTHWLLSEVYLATGQAALADAEAAAAYELEPNNAGYQLRRAQTLTMLGQYDDAVLAARAVLDRPDAPQSVRAQALYEMARLASLGDAEIASKAIPFYTQAIELADKLAVSNDAQERRAAKHVLVEAHVAVAEEIARQSFNQKVETISLWIGRASGLAEKYIADDGGSLELRLLIAQRALASLASFKPTLDPAPWVVEAEEAADALFAQSDDPLWQQHVKWELGKAYLNALRVEHSRREPSAAIRYGQRAIDYLAEGASSRQAVHASEQLVGQLYFHMGAVYSVHQQDHEQAAEWYDKAAPMLTAPRPVSELYSPRREGEMLVSIGVSYWQLGQQARALEVTQTGTELVELAVQDGILGRGALAVPYGNLATMYEQMGETTNAAKYSELAKSAGTPSPTPSERAARTTTPRATPARSTNSQARGPVQNVARQRTTSMIR